MTYAEASLSRLILDGMPPWPHHEWGECAQWKLQHLGMGALINYMSDLELNPFDIRILCARSYRHPNGFWKFPLVTSDRGTCVRLHIWIESEGSTRGCPHDHSWPFGSLVLCGGFEESEWLPVSGTEVSAVKCGRWSAAKEGYDVAVSPQSDLQQQKPVRVCQGSTRWTPPHVVHTLQPVEYSPQGLAATLVITGDRLPTPPTVWTPATDPLVEAPPIDPIAAIMMFTRLCESTRALGC